MWFGSRNSEDSSKKTFSVTDAEIKKLYRSARRDIYGPWYLQRKVVFSAAVLLLGFAVALLYLSGFWAKLPFVPASLVPVPSDEEIIANLSAVYGKVEVMTVKGNSMFPSFTDGQKVFVATEYYKNNPPRQGDVVSVRLGAANDSSGSYDYYIKRVAFVPGDSFTRSDSLLSLNRPVSAFSTEGRAFVQELVINLKEVLHQQLVGYGNVVPNGTMVVLGDNPQDSVDSRNFGLVLVSELSGKVVK